MQFAQEFFPAKNISGVFAFRRLVELALTNAGLLCDLQVAAMGELNDAVLVAIVNDGHAAAAVIKRELKGLCFLPFTQIGLRMPNKTWVCLHPSPDVRMDWLMDSERGEHSHEQLKKALLDRFETMFPEPKDGKDGDQAPLQ